MASIFEMREKHKKDKFGYRDLLDILTTGLSAWSTIAGHQQQKKQADLAAELSRETLEATKARQAAEAEHWRQQDRRAMIESFPELEPEMRPVPGADYSLPVDDRFWSEFALGQQKMPGGALYQEEKPDQYQAWLMQHGQASSDLADILIGAMPTGAEAVYEQIGGPLRDAEAYEPVSTSMIGVKYPGGFVPAERIAPGAFAGRGKQAKLPPTERVGGVRIGTVSPRISEDEWYILKDNLGHEPTQADLEQFMREKVELARVAQEAASGAATEPTPASINIPGSNPIMLGAVQARQVVVNALRSSGAADEANDPRVVDALAEGYMSYGQEWLDKMIAQANAQ